MPFIQKTFQIVALIFILSACTNHQSKFFKNCTCKPIDLHNGIKVNDTLGKFSFVIPDSSWLPMRSYGDGENGLTVSDTTGGLRFFNVNQSSYEGDWNMDEELDNVEKSFDVVERGKIKLLGKSSHWHLVKFEGEAFTYYSLFVSHIESDQKELYTLNMATEESPELKVRLCELESILHSLKIYR